MLEHPDTGIELPASPVVLQDQPPGTSENGLDSQDLLCQESSLSKEPVSTRSGPGRHLPGRAHEAVSQNLQAPAPKTVQVLWNPGQGLQELVPSNGLYPQVYSLKGPRSARSRPQAPWSQGLGNLVPIRTPFPWTHPQEVPHPAPTPTMQPPTQNLQSQPTEPSRLPQIPHEVSTAPFLGEGRAQEFPDHERSFQDQIPAERPVEPVFRPQPRMRSRKPNRRMRITAEQPP